MDDQDLVLVAHGFGDPRWLFAAESWIWWGLFADTDYGPSAVQQGELDGWKTAAYAIKMQENPSTRLISQTFVWGEELRIWLQPWPPILEHKFQQIRHSCFWNCGWGISSVSCVLATKQLFPVQFLFFSRSIPWPPPHRFSQGTKWKMEGKQLRSLDRKGSCLTRRRLEMTTGNWFNDVQRPSCGKASEQ